MLANAVSFTIEALDSGISTDIPRLKVYQLCFPLGSKLPSLKGLPEQRKSAQSGEHLEALSLQTQCESNHCIFVKLFTMLEKPRDGSDLFIVRKWAYAGLAILCSFD